MHRNSLPAEVVAFVELLVQRLDPIGNTCWKRLSIDLSKLAANRVVRRDAVGQPQQLLEPLPLLLALLSATELGISDAHRLRGFVLATYKGPNERYG